MTTEIKSQEAIKVEVKTLSKRLFEQMEYIKYADLKELLGQVNLPTKTGYTIPVFFLKKGDRFYRVSSVDVYSNLSGQAPTTLKTFLEIREWAEAQTNKLPQIYLV